MSTQLRIGLALAGIVVLIATAVVISGTSGDDEPSNPTGGVTAATGATGAGDETAGSDAGDGGVAPEAPKPGPGPVLKTGAIKVIKVDKGDTVRFRGRSEEGDELHVHGYDRTIQLPPGKTVSVRFRATLDGVYEIEMHHSGEQVGELRVSP